MTDGIEKYVRPHLVGFAGYSASTSPDTLKGKLKVTTFANLVKVNANENPYGCSPRVLKALGECEHFHVYPDDGQMELRRLLSDYTNVPAARIVAGHGSNTIIDSIVRLFVGPGDEVINSIPTFDIYRFSTEICGGTVVNINRDDNFAVDVEKIQAAITDKTKLIFLATPNNPTGNIVPHDDIVKVIETGLPVVVDEAYFEFSGETVMPLTERYDNLIVLRSFSKWAGLAGLRVGYGVFPSRIAAYMMAIKIPHNVSVAAEIAVRESLADFYYLQSRVKAIISERTRLFNELEEIPWLKPYPSKANFIYCAILRGDASEIHQRLQKKGILVRYFDNPLLKNSIRISVGKPEHTDAIIKALRER
ncbi:MAG: histidinol-phosphate transaminase [Dehalococcoidales bacterium]